MITLYKKLYSLVKAVNLKLFRNNRTINQACEKATSHALAKTHTNFPYSPPTPSFLNQIPVGVILLSTEAEILFCNTTGYKLLHRSEAELLGKIAFDTTWQVIQADGRSFTNPKQLLTPQEIVLGILHKGNVTETWLLVNTQASEGEKVVCTFSDITEHYKAQAALRQSEARFYNLAANVPGMIYQFVLYPDGSMTFPYVSPYCKEIFEVEPEQVQKNGYLIVAQVHPDNEVSFLTSVMESAQTLQPWIWEGKFITPSGEIKWIAGASRPEKLPNGNILWDGLLMDVSKRKQAETALAQAKDELEIKVEQRTKELRNTNQQLLVEIVERAAVELALKASETKFRQLARQEELLNSLATQIRTSLDLDTILATTVTAVLELLQIDRCGFMWYKNTTNGGIWRIVKEVHHPDLPAIPNYFSAAEVGAINEKLLKLEILRVDNVEKLADTQLCTRLQAIGNTAILSLPIQTDYGKIGVLTCGHSRTPRPWDDSEVELLQKVVNQLAIAINQAYLYTQASEAATEAQTRSQELQQALEQLQKTQAQLVQSEKMSSIGQMVAGVAHEINNPISFISGNLTHANQYTFDLLEILRLYEEHYPQSVPAIEKLKQTIELEFVIEDLPKLFNSMQVGAQRIRDIVLSLRNFSRLDEADMKCVNLHEGIDSTLLILQHRLNAKAHQSEIQVIKEYADLPKVECYPRKLNQVFMNILTNAIDAFEESFVQDTTANHQPSTSKPTIYICTEIALSTVRIRIADNGHGMSKEIVARIFDPFFTTKPVGSGTGLGLSISYQIIVENHKGTINCVSSIAGGTEFIIEIPIRQKYRSGGFTDNLEQQR